MKYFSFVLLAFTLVISACTAATSETNRYAEVIAGTTCLLFETDITPEEAETRGRALYEKYEISEHAEIQAYIESIRGTESHNQLAVEVRELLEKQCGDALLADNLTAAEMAEAIVME